MPRSNDVETFRNSLSEGTTVSVHLETEDPTDSRFRFLAHVVRPQLPGSNSILVRSVNSHTTKPAIPVNVPVHMVFEPESKETVFYLRRRAS